MAGLAILRPRESPAPGSSFRLLAAFWGASTCSSRSPSRTCSRRAMIVFARTALAAPGAAARGSGRRRAAHSWPVAGPISALAAVQVAAPFMLISFGEQHISSSLTGILVATGAGVHLPARHLVIGRDQEAQGLGIAGVALGIAGRGPPPGGGHRRRRGRAGGGPDGDPGQPRLRAGRLLPQTPGPATWIPTIWWWRRRWPPARDGSAPVAAFDPPTGRAGRRTPSGRLSRSACSAPASPSSCSTS